LPSGRSRREPHQRASALQRLRGRRVVIVQERCEEHGRYHGQWNCLAIHPANDIRCLLPIRTPGGHRIQNERSALLTYTRSTPAARKDTEVVGVVAQIACLPGQSDVDVSDVNQLTAQGLPFR